jgi:transcriptional regulator with XRE-family HTH domain
MTTENQPPRYAEFGKRFGELLQASSAKGNQSECARAMNCTPQAVSKWASGIQLPRGEQMEKLAAFLGTTAAYLRFGKGGDEVQPPPIQASSPKFVLMYVDIDTEVPLLNDFRLGTERGQKQLLAAARRMEKRPEGERPPEPASPEY